MRRWAFFRLSPAIVSDEIYGSNPLLDAIAFARYVREHSAKDSRIAVIGSEPEIYFDAQRHSATGFIYTYPLMENQPYAAAMQHQMMGEIEAAKPAYIIMVANRYSWLLKDSSDTDLLEWAQKYLAGHYERVGIVDDTPGKPGVELWGAEAKNYHGSLSQFLDVYQRKPPAN